MRPFDLNEVQQHPKPSPHTWASWKRDENNKSEIPARQGQRAGGRQEQEPPHRHAYGKETNSREAGPTKTFNIKRKLTFRKLDKEAKLGTYRQIPHVP